MSTLAFGDARVAEARTVFAYVAEHVCDVPLTTGEFGAVVIHKRLRISSQLMIAVQAGRRPR
jgi:hypothetical protein